MSDHMTLFLPLPRVVLKGGTRNGNEESGNEETSSSLLSAAS